MIQLKAKPLTQQSFAKFGDVIDTASATTTFPMNFETATRYYDLASVDITDNDGETCISLVKSTAIALPFEAKVMEKHPLGSQIFHPLGNFPFLVLVAPPADNLDSEQLELFISDGTQGVNYHKGVWHHYLISLKENSEFIVIDRKANDDNCIMVDLADSITINI